MNRTAMESNDLTAADVYDDHADMVDREIARQQELMKGLTREDAQIMACDWLNPDFGLSPWAEAALLADRRDAELMRHLSDSV